METWEYCRAVVTSVGLTSSQLGLRVYYYSADGNHRAEEISLDPHPKSKTDNWHLVLGRGLAPLGRDGWELVTVEANGAVLKCQVALPSSQ